MQREKGLPASATPKALQAGISTLLIILIVVSLVIVIGGGVLLYQYLATQQIGPTTCTKEAKVCPDGSTVSRTEPNCEFAECPKLIGGDKDSHGCLIAAGYSWCEVKNKCLRTWEEKCEATATDQTVSWKTYTNTQYGYQIKYPLTAQLKINDMFSSEGCVYIEYKDGGLTFWGQPSTNPDALCGGMTGRGIDNVSLQNQKITIGQKDYYVSGDTNKTKTYYSLGVGLSDKLGVYYFLGSAQGGDTDKMLRLILSTFKFTN